MSDSEPASPGMLPPGAIPVKNPRVAVQVVMRRERLANRWQTERWIVADVLPADERREAGEDEQVFGGFELGLFPDEAENYYLNVTAPDPRIFVMWRLEDDGPQPQAVTVSYGEAARWLDSSEQVDGVPMPAPVRQWVEEYVTLHYQPEPKKRRRPRSFVEPAKRAVDEEGGG